MNTSDTRDQVQDGLDNEQLDRYSSEAFFLLACTIGFFLCVALALARALLP